MLLNDHPDQERNLFAGIAAGRESDFQEFHRQTSGKLYAYFFKTTHEPQVVRELMQETYICLWDGRRNLSEVQHPYLYLLRIASRVTSHYLGSFARQRNTRELSEADQKETPLTATDTGHIEARDLLQHIEKAVRHLPPQQQRVFRLSRYEGLNYQEIADQLQIAVPTVSRNLAEARRKLRAWLPGME